jgi:hypothetical protein
MRNMLYALSFLAVIGLAFWAYRENYATRTSLRTVNDLQTEISGLQKALLFQRAEWAYLNRPDRLRELATINFDRLGLFPLEPSQFGQIGQVAFPLPQVMPNEDPQTVAALQDAGAPAQTDNPAETSEIVDSHEVQVP